jgi:hypothetical protein
MEPRRRSARLTAVKVEVKAEPEKDVTSLKSIESEQQAGAKPAVKRKRVKKEVIAGEPEAKASPAPVKPSRRRVKTEDDASSKQKEKKTIRKRAVKQEAEPLMDPTNTEAEMYAFEGNEWWVGAHMSVAGGVENSVSNARLYGCQAWALFLRPKMQWECKPISEDNIRLFAERLPQYKYDAKRCLPHASYLINLGNPDKEKRSKSLDAFMDELRRCALLRIGLYNFHPGVSTRGRKTRGSHLRCAQIKIRALTPYVERGRGDLQGRGVHQYCDEHQCSSRWPPGRGLGVPHYIAREHGGTREADWRTIRRARTCDR